MDRIPPATKALLLACGLIFLLQSQLGEVAFLNFMLWPAGEYALGMYEGRMITAGFLPWQLLSYGFLHGSVAHLAFNALALFMFGSAVEQVWGARRYAYYVLFCIVGAGLIQLAVATWSVSSGSQPYPTVGISGGVFGVLLAYGMMFPERRVMLLFPPIPMKARTFVIVFGTLELLLGLNDPGRGGVAHFAHLGGMAGGYLMIRYWRGSLPFVGKRRR